MKNITVISIVSALFVLSACQNGPTESRNVAQDSKDEKAYTSSKISLEVKDQNATNPPATTTPIVTDRVGIVVNASGLLPNEINTELGKELMIFNALDKQVDLYTTIDGTKPCENFGATIEIPGGQTKTFKLEKGTSCTIINQQNTDQKATVNIK